MHGIYLIGAMIITGGAIAFIGDKLGTKIGKKRLSIFGLRPRHTSMVITVLTGFFITGLSIGTMSILSEDVRTAFFGMEKLNATMAETKKTLSHVVDELTRTQNEYTQADLDLKNSQKEIENLQAEQKELSEESERLKKGNEQLEAEKNNLTQQNVELAESNKKLGEFNITLTADNEKLAKNNSELEEHAKNLREGLVAIREGDIAFRAGEILASTVISGGKSANEIAEDINKLADNATKNVSEKFGDAGDSEVWIYQPEIQEAIDKISASNQDMVLRISAAGNLVRGEPVRANLAYYPNNLIYDKGQFVAAGFYEVNSEADAENILKKFFAEVNKAAVEKGILADPITGTVGVMDGEQVYEIIDAVGQIRGGIRLTAYALEQTKSVGPLRLHIQIDKKI